MASLSVRVSESLLQSLKRRATEQCRSLDKEVADLIATGLQRSGLDADELNATLQPLELMTDDDLWNAARSRLPRRLSRELERLHQQRQADGSTTADRERARLLTDQYERCLVIRARAVELLHARGHDISRLLLT